MINNLKGGVGDNTPPENIDVNQLSIGVQVEMEHTNDPNVAKEIAMDHLTEDPEYYSKLIKAGLAKEFQPSANSGFGDPNVAINDKARVGNPVSKFANNMAGTMGNTPNGEVNGRRSEPIINKTVDIELQEKKKSKKPKPTNSSLWSRAKAMARAKFDVYPSAYANAWAAKWYKKKGGGWRMSECNCDCTNCDPNKNPLNAFDAPTPAEVSPDGLGTYGSGYDFVGYAENKDKTMKEQKLKEIIKNIIKKQLNEQTETDDIKVDADKESVTVTMDREVAQKLHDLLMQQLTPEPSTETPTTPATPEPTSSEPEASTEVPSEPTATETPSTDSSTSQETELKEGGKQWIQKAISKPGALHKQLGVPAGEKIPAGKLKAAAEKGGKLGKRARLAMTLSKIAKKKKK